MQAVMMYLSGIGYTSSPDRRAAHLELIEVLTTIQRAHRWDDAEMARRLGVSYRMWGQTRNGSTRFGHRALRNVLRAFPELGPEVLVYLRGEDPEPAAAVA